MFENDGALCGTGITEPLVVDDSHGRTHSLSFKFRHRYMLCLYRMSTLQCVPSLLPYLICEYLYSAEHTPPPIFQVPA